MLHLNLQINAEQKALLAAMPPLKPNATAVQAANLAYLPPARVMAQTLGGERFEAASWANLAAKLGIARPY